MSKRGPYARMTAAEKAEAAILYAEGYHVDEIAAHYGVGGKTAHRYLADAGVRLRPSGFKRIMVMPDIAEYIRVRFGRRSSR